MDIIGTILTATIGGVVPAVAVVATVRAQVQAIRDDISDLKYDIRRAHGRLDDHIRSVHTGDTS